MVATKASHSQIKKKMIQTKVWKDNSLEWAENKQ